MSIPLEIDALRHAIDELFNLGSDGEPIYVDRFRELNTEIYRLSEELYPVVGNTPEEEAALCIALLAGYHATVYNHGDKEEKVQCVLNRSWKVLERFSDSVLKCHLLVLCYGEVFDEELACEAHRIINTWGDPDLTPEEVKIVALLEDFEKNPYSWSEV